MQLHALARSRLRPAYLAAALAAALVAVIGVVSFLTPVSEAQAKPNRRICRYVWQQGMGNPDKRLISFVMNYVVNGKCPYIVRLRVSLPKEVGSYLPSPDAWEKNPVPKITCEQLQDSLTLPDYKDPLHPNDKDPCYYMVKDHLYAVGSHLDSDPPKGATDLQHSGRLWDLGDVSSLTTGCKEKSPYKHPCPTNP